MKIMEKKTQVTKTMTENNDLTNFNDSCAVIRILIMSIQKIFWSLNLYNPKLLFKWLMYFSLFEKNNSMSIEVHYSLVPL